MKQLRVKGLMNKLSLGSVINQTYLKFFVIVCQHIFILTFFLLKICKITVRRKENEESKIGGEELCIIPILETLIRPVSQGKHYGITLRLYFLLKNCYQIFTFAMVHGFWTIKQAS